MTKEQAAAIGNCSEDERGKTVTILPIVGTLIVMQGAPGSGKSTVAQAIQYVFHEQGYGRDTYIASADDFFYNGDGKYCFNPKLLGQAHERCQKEVQECMENGVPVIVVDNTNIQAWQAKPYVKLAVQHNYAIQFIRCTGSWGNVHGVPADKVTMMAAQLENLTVEACLNSKAPWEKS